jgi:bacterial/archaeal transporter family-2 protein
MNKIIWILLAFLSGAILPIQAGLNTRLGKALESPVYASMVSFVVGFFGLLLYILITRQTVSWSGVKDAPTVVWLGGLLGAFYVTVIILAFPKLGPGLTFGLIVAGQMIVSMVLEHFNILVAQPTPISFLRVLGMILVVAGVILIRKF